MTQIMSFVKKQNDTFIFQAKYNEILWFEKRKYRC